MTKTKVVTARDVEWVLGPWIGKTNTNRTTTAMPESMSSVESDTFGMVKPLHLQEPTISAMTQSYPNLVEFINLWMGAQMKGKDFTWSSLTLNRSWMSARHRDKNDAGISAIVSFCNHVGGD